MITDKVAHGLIRCRPGKIQISLWVGPSEIDKRSTGGTYVTSLEIRLPAFPHPESMIPVEVSLDCGGIGVMS